MSTSTLTPRIPGQKAAYPELNFITILDPSESRLPSKRKAVRSHAALCQSKQPRRRRRRTQWTGEVMILGHQPIPISTPEEKVVSLPTTEYSQPMTEYSQSACRIESPSAGLIGAGRVDPFRTYPVPWDPSLPELIDHYITNMMYPVPQLDEPNNPCLLRTRWFPMVLTEAATFQVVLLLAASHFALLHPSIDYGPSLLQRKSKAIASVRSSLLADGPTDQLIGAVVKLASYEAMFGDQESFDKHMVGLVKMVEMRGGLACLGLNGMLGRMCIWIDLNAAMVHNRPRYFPSIPKELCMDIDLEEVNVSSFLASR